MHPDAMPSSLLKAKYTLFLILGVRQVAKFLSFLVYGFFRK